MGPVGDGRHRSRRRGRCENVTAPGSALDSRDPTFAVIGCPRALLLPTLVVLLRRRSSASPPVRTLPITLLDGHQAEPAVVEAVAGEELAHEMGFR